MHQNIIGKNVRITKNVRDHIANKMQNIKMHADRIIDANIICEYMHGEYTVQGTIAFGKKVFHDKEKEKDLYAAIDSMFQKIEREIRKSKEKNIDRSQRAVVDKSVQIGENNDSSYYINSVGIYEKPLDELDALMHFNSDKKPYLAYMPIKQGKDLYSIKIGKFPVFLFRGNDNKTFEIYNSNEGHWNIDEVSITADNNIDAGKSEDYLIKEYNVSEAVNYLTENSDKKFIVYISSITEQAEALYKESDNSFVLIRMFDI